MKSAIVSLNESRQGDPLRVIFRAPFGSELERGVPGFSFIKVCVYFVEAIFANDASFKSASFSGGGFQRELADCRLMIVTMLATYRIQSLCYTALIVSTYMKTPNSRSFLRVGGFRLENCFPRETEIGPR